MYRYGCKQARRDREGEVVRYYRAASRRRRSAARDTSSQEADCHAEWISSSPCASSEEGPGKLDLSMSASRAACEFIELSSFHPRPVLHIMCCDSSISQYPAPLSPAQSTSNPARLPPYSYPSPPSAIESRALRLHLEPEISRRPLRVCLAGGHTADPELAWRSAAGVSFYVFGARILRLIYRRRRQ